MMTSGEREITEPGGGPGPTEGTADLDAFLCFALYSAGLALNRAYKPLLDRYGLTYSQYLLLVALRAQEDQTVSELGEQLFLESNTLTPLIKRLEAAGLVRRRRDTKDERVVRVSLTDEGHRLIGEALACVPSQMGNAMGMPVEELIALKDQVVRLRDQLLESRTQ